MRFYFKNSALFIIFSSTLCAFNLELKNSETIVNIGGRVELNTFMSSPDGSHNAQIPIDSIEKERHLTMSASSSRLWLKTRVPSKYGVIRSIIETDFNGVKGTETNTNSHNLRLRNAYIQVGNWTIGQTNSAFNAYITTDIILTAINDTFVRQPLIRYGAENRSWRYDISFEQPETTLLDSNAKVITPKDDIIPDIIARILFFEPWGDIAFSAMGRYLNQNRATLSDDTQLQNSDSALAWGLNFSAKLKVFKRNDIRIAYHYGDGMGRYLSYDAYPAGYINNDGKIETQKSFGGHIAYCHWWNKELKSTVALSYSGTKNNSYFKDNDDVNKELVSSQLNLFWLPIQNSLIGIEYAKASRTVESGKKGNIEIVTLMMRYNF